MTGYESKRAMAQDKLAQPESTAGYGKKIESLIPERDELRDEIKKLQKALSFWHPGVPANDSECAERCANDAYLLAGYDGDSEPSARELGWIEMVEKQEQPAQEPKSVTYKEVADTMNALRKGTFEQRQIADEMENKRLYTAPTQRPWVGLTEEDFSAINQSCFTKLQAATSAESILKEKNNG